MEQHVSTEEQILASDPANKTCVDCQTAPATVLSVNNGVTLCDKCKDSHFGFGTCISLLVLLKEPIDNYMMRYFLLGGNTKFLNFCKENGIADMPAKEKYLTEAADFYRRNLKVQVLDLGKLQPDFANPKNIITRPKDHFVEFFQYLQAKIEREKEANSYLGKIKTFFNNVADKVNESNIGKQVKLGGEKINERLTRAGTYIAEKSEPLKKSVEENSKIFGNKVAGAYDTLKAKIAGKSKEETPGVAVPLLETSNKNNTEVENKPVQVQQPVQPVQPVQQVQQVQPAQTEPVKQPEQPNYDNTIDDILANSQQSS